MALLGTQPKDVVTAPGKAACQDSSCGIVRRGPEHSLPGEAGEGGRTPVESWAAPRVDLHQPARAGKPRKGLTQHDTVDVRFENPHAK